MEEPLHFFFYNTVVQIRSNCELSSFVQVETEYYCELDQVCSFFFCVKNCTGKKRIQARQHLIKVKCVFFWFFRSREDLLPLFYEIITFVTIMFWNPSTTTETVCNKRFWFGVCSKGGYLLGTSSREKEGQKRV